MGWMPNLSYHTFILKLTYPMGWMPNLSHHTFTLCTYLSNGGLDAPLFHTILSFFSLPIQWGWMPLFIIHILFLKLTYPKVGMVPLPCSYNVLVLTYISKGGGWIPPYIISYFGKFEPLHACLTHPISVFQYSKNKSHPRLSKEVLGLYLHS